MAASSDQYENGASDKSAELGRLVAETLLKSPFLAMHPTLVPPTAALAAATIIGFGLSTQVAGTFFGALQGAMDVANRFAAEQGNAAAGPADDADGAKNNATPSHPNGAVDGAAAQHAGTMAEAPAQPMNGAAYVARTRRSGGKASTAKAQKIAASASASKVKDAAKKAVKANDLKRISGIGPKLEQLLNGLGIRAVEQIAAWSDDDVRRIDASLGIDGRIARDNWVEQAKALAARAAA